MSFSDLVKRHLWKIGMLTGIPLVILFYDPPYGPVYDGVLAERLFGLELPWYVEISLAISGLLLLLGLIYIQSRLGYLEEE